MIVDNLDNSALYDGLNPLFQKAFKYLKSLDLTQLEVGKTFLKDHDLFVMISDNTLKSKEMAKLEVHNQYIDIQMPITMTESFGWKHRSQLQVASAPFNEDKDIQFFDDQPSTYIDVEPGNFVIFFPQDAHAPCVGEGVVKKIVMKIKI